MRWVEIKAAKYARGCWPMGMLKLVNWYSKEQLIEIRHFAQEDYYAGYLAALADQELDNATQDGNDTESD